MEGFPGRRILRVDLERRPVVTLGGYAVVPQLLDDCHQVVDLGPIAVGLDRTLQKSAEWRATCTREGHSLTSRLCPSGLAM